MRKALIIMILILMAGCATNSQLCTVPEAQNSVVCELSTKLHTTPEMISQTLLVANMGALEADVYTAQQANKFVDDLISEIENFRKLGKTISYIDAIRYIDSKFKILPARVQAVFVIMNPAGLSDQVINLPLTDYDFDLLLRHLNKEKQIISVYLG